MKKEIFAGICCIMSIIFSASGTEDIAKLSRVYSWRDPAVKTEAQNVEPVIKTNAPPLMFVSIIIPQLPDRKNP